MLKKIFTVGLLFQGPLFQKMGNIYQLDQNQVVFNASAEASFALGKDGFASGHGGKFILGDPFFRDVLLQSAQLPTTPNIVLPVGIGKIEFFSNSVSKDKDSIIVTKIRRQEDRDFVCDILVTNDQDKVVERLSNYRVRILEKQPDGVSPDVLSNYGVTQDEHSLNNTIRAELKNRKLVFPGLVLNRTPDIHKLTKSDRHALEVPVV